MMDAIMKGMRVLIEETLIFEAILLGFTLLMMVVVMGCLCTQEVMEVWRFWKRRRSNWRKSSDSK